MRRHLLLSILALADVSFSMGRMGRMPAPKASLATPLATKTAGVMPLDKQRLRTSLASRIGLPALSYGSLGAVSVGTVYLLGGGLTGFGLVGLFSLGPVAMIIGQLATLGGTGVAKSVGGFPTKDVALLRLAEEAAVAVGVPSPTVYEIPRREPNAFATSGLGGKDCTVAVTSGLKELLSPAELGAVLAHEMGHLAHRDVGRNMHIAAAAAGLGGLYDIGRFLMKSEKKKSKSKKKDDEGSAEQLGLMLMAGGLATQAAAHGVRLMASRSAELRADRAAAAAFGAESIISALKKIDKQSRHSPADLRKHGNGRAFAFAMFSDGPAPQVHSAGGFHGFVRGVTEVFRTHPTLDKRVAALELAAENGEVPARHNKGRSWW